MNITARILREDLRANHVVVDYACGDVHLPVLVSVEDGDIEERIKRMTPVAQFKQLLAERRDLKHLIGKTFEFDASGWAAEDNSEGTTPPKMAAMSYAFNKDDVLPPHRHLDISTNHNIEVIEGHVVVRREQQGDCEARAGDIVWIALGELHSVEALEPSKTTHWLTTKGR